jgi:hypothetical protein
VSGPQGACPIDSSKTRPVTALAPTVLSLLPMGEISRTMGGTSVDPGCARAEGAFATSPTAAYARLTRPLRIAWPSPGIRVAIRYSAGDQSMQPGGPRSGETSRKTGHPTGDRPGKSRRPGNGASCSNRRSEFGWHNHGRALLPLRVRGLDRVRLHADLTILAKLDHRALRVVGPFAPAEVERVLQPGFGGARPDDHP